MVVGGFCLVAGSVSAVENIVTEMAI